MVTLHFARSPTCLGCLRRLAQAPSCFSPAVIPSSSTFSWTQTRAKATKAELEDLQGTPVRLLRDIASFGRKHAIIRVRPGRMRNLWFPKGDAEYMTKQRFIEMGLTESAIGVRDRTFGTQLLLNEEPSPKTAAPDITPIRKEALTVSPEETEFLLRTLLPDTLVFPRIPVATTPPPPPEPVVPRSPSLAANAATSISPPAPAAPAVTSIFGSVSRGDILAVIKEKLLADPQGGRVTLEAESLQLVGLDPEHDGENRIKRLGTFKVLITPGVGVGGKALEPVTRVVKVVPEQP